MKENEEKKLKHLIWQKTQDWPDSIDRDEVRQFHRSLELALAFTDFVVLFNEATGYSYGEKFIRFMSYGDPTLRKVALEMLFLDKAYWEEFEQSDHLSSEDPDYPFLLDVRYNIAALILSTMNATNPSLQRSLPMEVSRRLIRQIRGNIPDSPRWVVFPPIPETMPLLQKFFEGRFREITDREYGYLNVHEDMHIGWIATYASDKGLPGSEAYNDAFKDFVRRMGLEDFGKYILPIHLFPESYEDPTNPRVLLVTPREIERYAKEMGVSLEAISLTGESVRSLRLKDLTTSFIPIFYQLQGGEISDEPLFHAELSFVEANSISRLCYCLPETREEIVQGFYKGRVFEEVVLNILTGEDCVQVLQPEPFPAPVGFIFRRKDHAIEKDLVSYNYRTIETLGGRAISVTPSRFPSLEPFLNRIGKSETDIDLLLIHDSEPKHILLGECKFTHRYNEDYYRKGLVGVEALHSYLEESGEARVDLGLPRDYPIVPSLFMSYSGKFLRDETIALKVPIYSIFAGTLNSLVSEYLA